MTDVLVLDVAHAGCAIVRTRQRVIVIDAGHSAMVLRALSDLGISHVDQLILTHRHRDHTNGAYTLLADRNYSVGRLFVNTHPNNPDAKRINRAANKAWSDHKTVKQDVNVTTTSDLSGDDLELEILWPDIAHSNEGVGGKLGGQDLEAHDVAVVVRIAVAGGRSMLFCADASDHVLDGLIATNPEGLRANVLVYPHHGGKATSAKSEDAERQFAERLTQASRPELVVFSNGRAKFDNPRASVIRGVREGGAAVRIACTQINARCGGPAVGIVRPFAGLGTAAGHACAGTLRLELDPTIDLDAQARAHADLVQGLESADCMSSPD